MPPSANSKTPTRRRSAPVKAPRSWPKNSLSSKVGATALQSTATKSLGARWLSLWTSRATSSLPVPVSPVIKTDTSAVATC